MTENAFDSMFERVKDIIKKEFISDGIISEKEVSTRVYKVEVEGLENALAGMQRLNKEIRELKENACPKSYNEIKKTHEEQLREERQRERMSSIHQTFSRGFFKNPDAITNVINKSVISEVGVITSRVFLSSFYVSIQEQEAYGLIIPKFTKFIKVAFTSYYYPIVGDVINTPMHIHPEVFQKSGDLFLSASDIEQLKQLTTVTWDGNLIGKSNRDKLVSNHFAVKVEGGFNAITLDGVRLLNHLKLLEHAK